LITVLFSGTVTMLMKSDGHSRAISIGWKCYRNTCYRERRRLPTVLYTLRLCNRHALYCFFVAFQPLTLSRSSSPGIEQATNLEQVSFLQ